MARLYADSSYGLPAFLLSTAAFSSADSYAPFGAACSTTLMTDPAPGRATATEPIESADSAANAAPIDFTDYFIGPLLTRSSDSRVATSPCAAARFGRGFSRQNLQQMRQFYLSRPFAEIRQTLSGKSSPSARRDNRQTTSGIFPADLASVLPLPWSHYVRLLSVEDLPARAFYETEALRGGWTVRQLHRQIESQFYERTMLSRNKATMLTKGASGSQRMR